MAKVYKRLNSNFVIASTEIFKHKLSLKAIGLYLYIVDKPDGWNFSIEGVASQVSDGRDSVRSATKELESAGFLERRQIRNEGKFSDGDWIVTDKPNRNIPKSAENPMSENPTSENPMSEKHLQVNTNKVSTKEVSTKRALYSVRDSKNSLTPCTDEELTQIAKITRLRLMDVRDVHEDVMLAVQDGRMQSKYKSKTVYHTLIAWLKMRAKKGEISPLTPDEYRSKYGELTEAFKSWTT